MRVVKSVYMTYVEAIKDNNNGKLTDEEQKRAKALAIDKLKSYLGPTDIEELMGIFNFSANERDKYLSVHIESAVYDAKHGPHSGLRNGPISIAGPLGDIQTLNQALQTATPTPSLTSKLPSKTIRLPAAKGADA